MALRWATKAGNWVDPTVWNGGTVPGVGDWVYTNTFVIHLNTSISVDKLSTEDVDPNFEGAGNPQINSGGRFTVDTGSGITISIALGQEIYEVQYMTGHFFTIQPGSGSLTVNCPNIFGSFLLDSSTIYLSPGYTGAVVINGSLEGGWRGPAVDIPPNSFPASITINGDVNGNTWYSFGGSSRPCTIWIQGSTVIDVYGDVVGPNSSAGFGRTIYWYSLATTFNVHGQVRGGGPFGNNFETFYLSPQGTSVANYLNIDGDIIATDKGQAIYAISPGVNIRASGVSVLAPTNAFVAITNSATGAFPVRVSGVINSTPDGRLAIQGSFVAIADEPLEIIVREDTNYPTNTSGDPYTLTAAVLGTSVLVDGNAAEVEDRADGMLFAIEELDPDHVTLSMPEALDSPEVLVLAEQIQEVFAPATVEDVGSGWLTVIAKGFVGLADSSDPGGNPDYIAVVGTVTLTPSLTKPIRRLSNGDILVVSAVTATFDSNGDLSYDGVKDVRVVAPSWADLSNTAWKWNASIQAGPGQSWGRFFGSFTGVPGSTFDLSSLL